MGGKDIAKSAVSSLLLTLPALCFSESYIRPKLNFNFYFCIILWFFNGLMKVLQG